MSRAGLLAAGLAGVALATGGCELLNEPPPAGETAAHWYTQGGGPDAGGGTTTGDDGAGPAAIEAGAAGDTGGTPTQDGAAPGAGVALAVAAGNEHTCALTQGGGVLCWGAAGYGQLGHGTTTASPVPVPVTGLAGAVAALAAGSDHTCALVKADGGAAVQCWGRNEHGELGDGSTTDRPSPVTVGGLPAAVTAIAAGGAHTCALAAGSVWCWGAGADGQLGNGATLDAPSPVAVSAVLGATAIAAGGAHTCAVQTGGAVQCWGDGANGQLGSGSASSSAVPVAVTGLAAAATRVCAGNAYTCAITSAGAQCWGYGQFGQLGNSATSDSAVPVPVTALAAGLPAMAGGGEHACALDPAGGVWCWGEDASGQLGDDGAADRSVPVAVTGLASGVTAIAAGTAHTCAVVAGGHVMCWGWNVSGQLGDGTLNDSAVPLTVVGL